MKDRTLVWASLVMIIAVALGAFGAHGLKDRIGPAELGQWNTGVLYQMVHGLALFIVFAAGERIARPAWRLASALFLAGIICFSGSLYLLATRDLLGTMTLTPVLGPVTPLGGICFIAGWGALLAGALRSAKT